MPVEDEFLFQFVFVAQVMVHIDRDDPLFAQNGNTQTEQCKRIATAGKGDYDL